MNGPPPGDERDAYLDYLARCRQAFTPFAPIELPDFFAGRSNIIEDILGELSSPGRQVAIFGERGVGKTSLAALLYFFADYQDDSVQLVRCSRDSNFDTICAELLAGAGAIFSLESARSESDAGLRAAAGPIRLTRGRATTYDYRTTQEARPITPGRVLAQFQSERSLLIVDEYDRVGDSTTHARLAELIKHFSDARSESKIVVVGVAETLTQLIGEHESLSRSLAQIRLHQMNAFELDDIIERGQRRTGAAFAPSIAKKIVSLSDGFPHFVHLLCLYSAIAAGRHLLHGRPAEIFVGEREYRLGLSSAVQKAEHSLQEAYAAAVVTTRRKSDIYELALNAMALSEDRDVQVRQLASHASFLAGEDLRPEKFSNALGQLIKPDRGRILTKVRDGYYKFTNPLMRAYVRFLLELDNVVNRGGQLEFPFMRA